MLSLAIIWFRTADSQTYKDKNKLHNNLDVANLKCGNVPVEEPLGDAGGEEGAADDVGEEEEDADGGADLQPHRPAYHEVHPASTYLKESTINSKSNLKFTKNCLAYGATICSVN